MTVRELIAKLQALPDEAQDLDVRSVFDDVAWNVDDPEVGFVDTSSMRDWIIENDVDETKWYVKKVVVL